jgi:phosphate transport system permease protein
MPNRQPVVHPRRPELCAVAAETADIPLRPETPVSAADKLYRRVATTAASVSLVIVVLTLVFLVNGARPALKVNGIVHFFTRSLWEFQIDKFGVFGLILGTIVIATIALVVAVPLALAMALFINEYAPKRIRQAMTSVIDLLAALPSIVFGMWGLFAFQDRLSRVATWLSYHFSFVPIFRASGGTSLVQSSLVAGVVVGIMVMPIVISVSRDVMSQVPRDLCEGALALGGTRWGMIREVILPFGRSGIVGAILLGFGRALGETIAVALIVVQIYKVNSHILTQGAGTIASLIANRFGDASSLERSGLVAAGLALFVLTLIVNLVARLIVSRTGIRAARR